MQLDGFNNQVEFPVATTSPLPTNTVAKLIWTGIQICIVTMQAS